ncbi:hypothetical protein XH94_23065 [Bradyrhizobium zhanjiangense]|uniref:Uncharacterized protein n=1 Tax=Bradyrhizobium zhanjiangense TaxID=1325107 RepID=A0A4V1L3J2_9BRAD|nr:hypothetical protein XH94_23065 [Bradyrhizobium zhanjiangense]
MVEAPRLHQYRAFGMNGSRVRGVKIGLSGGEYDRACQPEGPEMVYCPKESVGITLSDEPRHITAQRLTVELSNKAWFVFCEEPTAKATKRTCILAGGVSWQPGLDEGLLEPRDIASIVEIKRPHVRPCHNSPRLSRPQRGGRAKLCSGDVEAPSPGLDEGLLKPRDNGSILGRKRPHVLSSHNPRRLSRLQRRRCAVLRNGVVEAPRFHPYRAFGMDGGHVRGAGLSVARPLLGRATTLTSPVDRKVRRWSNAVRSLAGLPFPTNSRTSPPSLSDLLSIRATMLGLRFSKSQRQ